MRVPFCVALFFSIFSLQVLIPLQAAEYTFGTFNWKWAFDHDESDNRSDLAMEMSAPSLTKWQWRVRTASDAIAELNPTVLALQEIEDAGVVQELADALRQEYGLEYKVAFVQGLDTFTEQDVACLVKEDITFTVSRFDFTPQTGFKNISKHLHLQFSLDGEPFSLIAVHLITRDNQRIRQARTLRKWIDSIQDGRHIVAIGDFNFHKRVDEIESATDTKIIRGLNTRTTNDDLYDMSKMLPRFFRRTHRSRHELDRILVSESLRDGSGLEATSIYNHKDVVIRGQMVDGFSWDVSDDERDISDHYPLVATIKSPDLDLAAAGDRSGFAVRRARGGRLLHAGTPTPSMEISLDEAGVSLPIEAAIGDSTNTHWAVYVLDQAGSVLNQHGSDVKLEAALKTANAVNVTSTSNGGSVLVLNLPTVSP